MQAEKLVQARVSKDLYSEVDRRVRSGLYANTSEVVREALRKMIAEEARERLRELTKASGITEKQAIRELRKIRG